MAIEAEIHNQGIDSKLTARISFRVSDLDNRSFQNTLCAFLQDCAPPADSPDYIPFQDAAKLILDQAQKKYPWSK